MISFPKPGLSPQHMELCGNLHGVEPIHGHADSPGSLTNLNVCRTGIEEEEEKVASIVKGGWAIRAEAGLLRWEAGHNTVDSHELTSST